MNATELYAIVKSNPPENPDERNYWARLEETTKIPSEQIRRATRTEFHKEFGLKANIQAIYNAFKGASEARQSWESDASGNMTYEYVGPKSITTLDEALEFCRVDQDKYEVKWWKFNSWDVSARKGEGFIKSTNYQVKVDFAPKQPPVITQQRQEEIKKVAAAEFSIAPPPKQKWAMYVVAGCIHRPFHDKDKWNSFLSFLHDNRASITGLVLNGDYLDLKSLSSHDEGKVMPDGISLSYEYEDGYRGIVEINEAIGKGKDLYYNMGNHEDRYYKEISKVSTARYGNALIGPTEALRLHENGYKVQYNWKDGYVLLGDSLEVMHGIYTSAKPGKSHLEKIPNRDVMFNHTHWVGIETHGKRHAYNIGCMIDMTSTAFSYTGRHAKHKWEHGFAVVYVDSNGGHHVNIVRSCRDGFFFGGKIY